MRLVEVGMCIGAEGGNLNFAEVSRRAGCARLRVAGERWLSAFAVRYRCFGGSAAWKSVSAWVADDSCDGTLKSVAIG